MFYKLPHSPKKRMPVCHKNKDVNKRGSNIFCHAFESYICFGDVGLNAYSFSSSILVAKALF